MNASNHVDKIRVGIIGVGFWARYGHIPALRLLDEYEITAVASRREQSAVALADEYDIPFALADYEALIDHPEVDLVVIPTPAPQRARLVKLAIAAGKDVYGEWPLTTTTGDSTELLDLAEAKGVRHVVGLQRRFSPSSRYLAHLVAEGYVGDVRGVHMSVNVAAFKEHMPSQHAWTLDPSNFVSLLPVYAGHFADMLFHAVGLPSALTAITENQFEHVHLEETGERVPYPVPTEVLITGTLSEGGLFSIQLEGGQERPLGLRVDITGTDGTLRVSNSLAFQNVDDNRIEGMNGDATEFSVLPVPAGTALAPSSDLDASVQDVADLYRAYSQDVRDGTSHATDFADAVRMHRMIDHVVETSRSFYADPSKFVTW